MTGTNGQLKIKLRGGYLKSEQVKGIQFTFPNTVTGIKTEKLTSADLPSLTHLA